ncbi:MAG: NUDIX domain-containing protein [Caulobacteraceae bacterium]|nr:NUDIX domain-containing protein [Caulobacteraceae bacterium]
MSIAEPRLAATVLLIRDRSGLEVLMVERHEQAYFSSALVFPGGVVDPEDRGPDWFPLVDGAEGLDEAERALRIAGYRELYEETGLLLADCAPAGVVTPATEQVPFVAVVERAKARLDLAAMHRFTHWITPEAAPKRFDTHFRLCGLGTELVAASDGRETVSVEWIRPKDALDLGASRQRKLLFPTQMNLKLLSQASSVEEAIADSKTRAIATVSPIMQQRPDGLYLTLPDDAGYGAGVEFYAGRGRPKP